MLHPRHWRAHAKLTLSLHVTGVRDDGYHLIDAEMVSLELHDLLTFDDRTRRGDGPRRRPARSPTGCPSTGRTSSPVPSSSPGAQAHVTIDKRIPHGGGLGGGSTDAATALRWGGFGTSADDLARRRGALGADIPFCLVGGRARVTGIGEIVEPLPHVQPADHADHPAAAREHPGGVPGVGRARPTSAVGRTQRPRGGGARRRAATRAVARRDPAATSGSRRRSPAAARRGSSRAISVRTDGARGTLGRWPTSATHTVDAGRATGPGA